MHKPNSVGVAAALGMVLLTSVCSAQSPTPGAASTASAPAAANPAEKALLDLLDLDLAALKERSPVEASRRGDRRFDTRWPDQSAEARAKYLAGCRQRLDAAKKIDRGALSPASRVTQALLVYELQLRLDGERFKTWQMPISQQNGPQISLPQVPDNLSFTTDKQREDYAARLDGLPAYLEQTIANMRQGVAEGRTPPKVVMQSVPQQALASAEERFLKAPVAHPMYKPFIGRSDAAAERARRAIAEKVVPAFKSLGEFLRDEYVLKCRESIAAADLPDGAAFYNFRVRDNTTTQLTAEQVHQTGMREVARIRAEMRQVIARSDYSRKGELSGDELFRAFIEYLRTDKRFYFDKAEDLLDGYRLICKRVDAELPRLFETLPRLSYGVREMPPMFAAAAPTAYYYPGSLENGVPGWFIANTYRLDQRPRYEMIALSLHEAVPGHHFQYSLAQELAREGMHEWRTWVDYTAFGEGWGLYTERLGLEMGEDARSSSNPEGRGFYKDPYDDFGRLSYEMWRAMRLVVDTGMHALGWSRQRSIDFMLENSALTQTNIEKEVDRYIAWPGQALGYKIGELRIRDLRSEAEATLQEKFDVRSFHDAVLLQGAVPLDVLAMQVREWVSARKGK